MEMTQLGHFVTTAKQESITKAAGMLNITQPTLSVSISRLEDELGVDLFDRTGNKIRLNDTGRVFLSYVEQALDLLRYGVEQACANDGILTSVVAFSVPDSSLVTEVWRDYVAEHPDVVAQRVGDLVAREAAAGLERGLGVGHRSSVGQPSDARDACPPVGYPFRRADAWAPCPACRARESRLGGSARGRPHSATGRAATPDDPGRRGPGGNEVR